MHRRRPRPCRIACAGFCRCGTTTGGGRLRTAAQDRLRGISPLRDDCEETRNSSRSRPTAVQDCEWSVAVAGAFSGVGAVDGAGAGAVAARIRRWGWSRPRTGSGARGGDGTIAGRGGPGAAEDHSLAGARSMGRVRPAPEVGPEPSPARSRRGTTAGEEDLTPRKTTVAQDHRAGPLPPPGSGGGAGLEHQA